MKSMKLSNAFKDILQGIYELVKEIKGNLKEIFDTL